ncbi:tRNA pseudouridine(13) synthase TruD [Stetteria hydrogenophila]
MAESLELLWGLEERLGGRPRVGGVAVVRRPWGFRVIEAGPRPLRGEGWSLYLVRAVGVDTRRAARLLAGLVGGRGASYAGLKDACAVKYQYISVKTGPAGAPGRVRDPEGRLEAWLVGRGRVAPGLHSGNFFRLTVEHPDPAGLCSAFRGLRWVPGYFGPQRFGVERPNTHYMGLLASQGLWGSLLREMASRYPLEWRRGLGGYEAAAWRRAREAASPWAAAGKAWWLDFALQALRAYLFNRALSRAARSGGVQGYAEHWVRVRCPGGTVLRAPAARLPGGYHLRSGSAWSRLVRSVAEEEGLTGALASWGRRVFRPLAYPVCTAWCRPSRGSAEVVLALPPGAYATVALWEVVEFDWLGYAECSPPVDGEVNR